MPQNRCLAFLYNTYSVSFFRFWSSKLRKGLSDLGKKDVVWPMSAWGKRSILKEYYLSFLLQINNLSLDLSEQLANISMQLWQLVRNTRSLTCSTVSRSGDQRILCSSVMSCDKFGSSKFVKGSVEHTSTREASVGRLFITSIVQFLCMQFFALFRKKGRKHIYRQLTPTLRSF